MQYADGSRGKVLSCSVGYEKRSSYLQMDGQEVFKFALKTVPDCIEEVLEKGNIEKEKVKYYVLHQANSRILSGVAKKLRGKRRKISYEHTEIRKYFRCQYSYFTGRNEQGGKAGERRYSCPCRIWSRTYMGKHAASVVTE